MFNLAWPWMLAALPLPLLCRWLMPPARAAQSTALRVPFFEATRAWEQDSPGPGRRRLRGGLLFLIWMGLVLTAARPQWIGAPLSMPVTGRDVFLAIDLSGSMDTQDQVLNGKVADRLSAVKHLAGDFIDRRVGDRIGVILFGTAPYVQVPLTFDRHMAQELLDDAVLGLAGGQTAIGDAIALAVHQLRDRPAASRVIVLLTDGENTHGRLQPVEAARLAAFYQMRVHTIGLVGSETNPGGDDGGVGRLRSEMEAIDERTLQNIARITGGSYFRARDTDGLAAVYRLLDQLEPAADHDDIVRPTAELFYWPLGCAYGLALLMALSYLALSYVTPGAISGRLERWRAEEALRVAQVQRGG